MNNKTETRLRLQNRFDSLLLDQSVDSMDLLKNKKDKKKAKPVKKLKPKEQPKIMEPIKIEKNPKKILSTNKPIKPVMDKEVSKLTAPFVQILTLDEYREATKGNRSQAPKFNVRQAGEGEDLSQWENLVPLQKKEQVEKEPGPSGREAGARTRNRKPVRSAAAVLGESLTSRTVTRRDLYTGRVSLRPEPVYLQPLPKVYSQYEFPDLDN